MLGIFMLPWQPGQRTVLPASLREMDVCLPHDGQVTSTGIAAPFTAPTLGRGNPLDATRLLRFHKPCNDVAADCALAMYIQMQSALVLSRMNPTDLNLRALQQHIAARYESADRARG